MMQFESLIYKCLCTITAATTLGASMSKYMVAQSVYAVDFIFTSWTIWMKDYLSVYSCSSMVNGHMAVQLPA